MNPAQCTSVIVENMCWLVYCGAIAHQKGRPAFEQALGKWATAMEKNPMAIYTFLARDTATLLDDMGKYMGDQSITGCALNYWLSFSVGGASLRNLADYNRANPVVY